MASALELSEGVARKAGAQQIVRLQMRIGNLSGVVPDALRFAFEAISPGTMAEGAVLEIEVISVSAVCPACGLEFEPTSLFYQCPQCGELSSDVRRGREIEVMAVEVE
jgi:hydrogenase nickel incorporation protein HypA/HybF